MQVLLMLLAQQDQLGQEAPSEVVQDIARFAMKLAAEGKLRGGHQLQGMENGFRVRAAEQGPEVLDGPYPENKELVAGTFEIEVDSIEEAKQIAAACPHLQLGPILAMPIRPRPGE